MDAVLDLCKISLFSPILTHFGVVGTTGTYGKRASPGTEPPAAGAKSGKAGCQGGNGDSGAERVLIWSQRTGKVVLNTFRVDSEKSKIFDFLPILDPSRLVPQPSGSGPGLGSRGSWARAPAVPHLIFLVEMGENCRGAPKTTPETRENAIFDTETA